MSEIEKLKNRVQKLSAVLDFYDSLKKRKITDGKELEDTRLKMDFAKKQMLKLCIESKKIIKEREEKHAIK